MTDAPQVAGAALPPKAATTAAPNGIQQVQDFFKRKPIVPLIAAVATTVAIIGGLSMWASAPDYRVMYSNVSDVDGGSIIAELQKRNVPYKLSQGGSAILVPSNKVNELRLQLAEQGLPNGGNVGFELMDSQSFGISQFAEHINFQRGLEGELTRSIESLGPVAKARVHLVMPKNSVFARDRENARASVVVHLHSGRDLGSGQVEAIKHMVSSSVPHLPAEAVTVVDQSGRLLSKPGNSAEILDGTQLTYIEEVELSYQRRIERILSPIVGANNVKAQVVAQIDFDSRERTAERYGPNQPPNEAAIRSQQLSENYSNADMARGVPGALTNSPPNAPAITTPNGGQPAQETDAQALAGKEGSLSRDKTINYEVDRNIEHVKHRTGGVERLSVAVVVNYREVLDEEGNPKAEPLSEAEMESINRLVRQAMGYSDQRGDEVAVINSPFSVEKDVVDELAWWKTPEFFSLVSTLAKYLLVAFVGLILWLAVIRPVLRRQQQVAELERARQEEELARIKASEEIAIEGSPDGQVTLRRKKPSYDHNLKGFIQMAKEDPRLVASVLHSWMNKKS